MYIDIHFVYLYTAVYVIQLTSKLILGTIINKTFILKKVYPF